MALDEKSVLDVLRRVKDPDLGRDIVSLGFVKNLRICGGKVAFDLELTTPACPVKDRMRGDCERAVRTLPGVLEVAVTLTAQVRGRPSEPQMVLEGVKNIVAVASGKGGVGKSTVSINLSVALAKSGATTGLLDADVYGPSIPLLAGMTKAVPQATRDQRLVPLGRHGVRLMSLGFLSGEETPAIWRGPIASRLIQQFLFGVDWGDLDYLVVDLPPGTGDIQLTLCQSVPISGAVVVTTPQTASLNVVRRGIRMFEQVKVPVLGVVENMSGFACPHCHQVTDIFRKFEDDRVLETLGVPRLGKVPIDPEVVIGGDEGTPIVVKNPKSPAAQAFCSIASRVAAELSVIRLTDSEQKGLELVWKP